MDGSVEGAWVATELKRYDVLANHGVAPTDVACLVLRHLHREFPRCHERDYTGPHAHVH